MPATPCSGRRQAVCSRRVGSGVKSQSSGNGSQHILPAEGRVAAGGNAQAVRGFLYSVPQMHGPNGGIFDPPPQGLTLVQLRLTPPAAQGAIPIGRGGASGLQSGRSERVFKSWLRSFLMFFCARWAKGIQLAEIGCLLR